MSQDLVTRLRRRVGAELHGRTWQEAARDLGGLARREGFRGILQRAGYRVERVVHQSAPAAPALNPILNTYKWGDAHNPLFDLTPEALAANHAIVSQFPQRPRTVHTATWFLSYFDHALFGGVYTILRLMDWMQAHHGVEHRMVVFDRPGARDEEIRAAVVQAFPGLAGIDIVLPTSDGIPFNELPSTDIGVATLWTSAYALAHFNRVGAKYYMVADFEPSFYPAGTVYALAEATYRLGFAGIVNTPGLDAVYASYGNPSVAFVPAVDAVETLERPSLRPGAPVRVVIYGRPSTDRNAFELLAAACEQLKAQHGDRIEILSAGEQWNPSEFGLDGVIENLGLLRSLEDVRALYASCDIGISFMLSKHPSYQPFEYLAAGVAPVCNENSATHWFLRHEENCLVTEPFPSHVAAAVTRLIEDPGLRDKIVETGQRYVSQANWSDEFAKVWSFVTNTADG